MRELPKNAARTFGIVAREAPRVVLLRRGPSKQVLCITWDTVRHEFRAGQWFKGRIYEQRCDLSPSGDKLIYLAADQRPPLYAWTAISRPPFLTALALWSNRGTWGGGGLFASERRILLNSIDRKCRLAENFHLPKDVAVEPIAEWAGRGEDDPIRSKRMMRDGWMLADEGSRGVYKIRAPVSWEFERPERWCKPRGRLILERRTLGIGERSGAWNVLDHRILDEAGDVVMDLGRSDWADWSRGDEVLLARDGRVGRIVITKQGPREFDELVDLRGLKFERMAPPPDATRWRGKEVKGTKIT